MLVTMLVTKRIESVANISDLSSTSFENLNLHLYPGWPSVVEMLQDFVFVVAIFVVRVLVQVAAVLLLVLAVVAAVVEFEVVAKNIVLLRN